MEDGLIVADSIELGHKIQANATILGHKFEVRTLCTHTTYGMNA